MRNWKKRFFRLTTRELRYYEKGSEEPRGVIRLDDVRSVRPTRGTGAFEVLTNSGKDFALIAENDTERKEWIDAIDQTRFKPSTQTKLLRETSTLYHLGRIDDRVRAVRAFVLVFSPPPPSSFFFFFSTSHPPAPFAPSSRGRSDDENSDRPCSPPLHPPPPSLTVSVLLSRFHSLRRRRRCVTGSWRAMPRQWSVWRSAWSGWRP